MGKLDGKVALVTGASRGIGKEIAQRFAQEGAKVFISARTVEEGSHPLPGSLNTTIDEIRAAGGEISAFACDISDYENCQTLVQEARSTYGPIDILVNNAALTYFIPLIDFPVRRWLRSTAVNMHAPFYLSQLCLPDMIDKHDGAIVNIGSPAAVGPGRAPYKPEDIRQGHILYGAEKAALERMSQGLAMEVYEHGVRVSCLSPSQIVPTPGVVFHHLLDGRDPNDREGPEVLAQATLLLATEPLDKVSGRVCYSQAILKEFGWRDTARGWGADPGMPGTGYAQI